MRLNELADNPGATKARLRVGRGVGSGKGKTAGRGGQMPIYMRLPKRGFNKPNRLKFAELSIRRLNQAVEAGVLPKGDIDAAALVNAGVIRRELDGVRLIGSGKLTGKVNLVVRGATPGATKIVEAAGGTVNVTGVKPAKVERTVAEKPAKKAKPAPKKAAPKAEAPKAEPKPKAEAKKAKPKVLYTDGATDGEPDDLKKIKGIGPKFEGDLNSKGIYYYRQIAAWKKADIEMVEGIIDSFPGRIERDEWVKQAAELAKG